MFESMDFVLLISFMSHKLILIINVAVACYCFHLISATAFRANTILILLLTHENSGLPQINYLFRVMLYPFEPRSTYLHPLSLTFTKHLICSWPRRRYCREYR